jgi:hypothetical protein
VRKDQRGDTSTAPKISFPPKLPSRGAQHFQPDRVTVDIIVEGDSRRLSKIVTIGRVEWMLRNQ